MDEQKVKTVITFIFILIFIGLFVEFFLVSIYFSNLSKLLNYIKNNYPKKWKELGEPTIFMGASPKSIIKTLRFIFSEYNGDDSHLKVLMSKTKHSLYVFIIYFLFLAILVISLPILFVLFVKGYLLFLKF